MTAHRLFQACIAMAALALCGHAVWAQAPKGNPPRKPVAANSSTVADTRYTQRSDVLQAADEMARTQELDASWVRQMLAQARYQPAVAKAVLPAASASAKNWQVYRSRFVEPKRIQAGVVFWTQYRDTLLRAQQTSGVPAEVIVGILGVETIYGQQMGQYRVLDALATLAFDFPAEHPRAAERSAYFKGELAQYLRLAQRNDIDPTVVRGSYAGAMGLPQFMPTSWSRFAVDFDGDGKVDLFQSPADAIGSVAEYLRAHGWQPGLPTHFPVQLSETTQLEALLTPDILPTFSAERFQALGATLSGNATRHPGMLALVQLLMGDDPAVYVAGTDNFYAITRYNWSSYYAMAVIELGQAVKAALPPLD